MGMGIYKVIPGYAKISDLDNYVTGAELSTTLDNYPTDTELSDALTGYVTDQELADALSGISVSTSEIRTDIDAIVGQTDFTHSTSITNSLKVYVNGYLLPPTAYSTHPSLANTIVLASPVLLAGTKVSLITLS